MIIAIHRTALTSAYGANAWTALGPVLQRFSTQLIDRGIPASLLYLDSPAASGLPGETAAPPGDPDAAARLIRLKVGRMPVRPTAVLLIGGHEAIPMHSLPRLTTIAGDRDERIPTDNPYGCLTGEPSRYVFPDLAVGRIAGGVDNAIQDIIDQLDRAIRLRQHAFELGGSFILSNLEWIEASRLVASQIGAQPQIFSTAPYYQLESGNVGDLRRRVHFINLHGESAGPSWYGGTENLPWPAVGPVEAAASEMLGSVVFACNCYGALIGGRSASQSIALTLLRRGCSGFVGSTGYAFGGLPPQTIDFSEDLAFRFFQHFRSGVPAGLALHIARGEYAAARTIGNRMDNRDIKTALQFVFLGDPLL